MALSICAEARGSPLRRRLCLLLEGATGRGREAGFCLAPDRGKISPFLVNGRYGLISQAPEISCRRQGGSRFTAYQSYGGVTRRHSRSSAFPRALDAVRECSQSTHPTHRWVRKPGSPLEEHFGQQAPAAQLTGARAPAGELLGHRSPAVPEQLSRHVLQVDVLLAPQSKRSSASDLVCEANTKHKEG